MATVSQITTNPVFWNGTAYTCINLPAGIQVSSGAEGVYAIRAHQIGWGESKFNIMNSDGSVQEQTIDSSQSLLTSIETSLTNIKEYADSKSFDFDVADLWGEYVPNTPAPPTAQP